MPLVDSIIQIGSGTDTALALKTANVRILQESMGMRSEGNAIPKLILLITDGQSNDKYSTIVEANCGRHC